MKGFTRSQRIEAPPAAVYAVLADLDAAPKWMPTIQATRWVTGDRVAAGNSWVETRQAGRRTMEATISVTQAEPGRHLHLQVDAKPFAMELDFALAPDGRGTQVTYTCQGRGKGLMALATGPIMRRVEAQDDDLIRRLKRFVEGQESTPTAGTNPAATGTKGAAGSKPRRGT